MRYYKIILKKRKKYKKNYFIFYIQLKNLNSFYIYFLYLNINVKKIQKIIIKTNYF